MVALGWPEGRRVVRGIAAELRAITREALATYRAFALPILAAAVVVFAPAALLEKEARRAFGAGVGKLPAHAQLATLLSFAVGIAGYWFFAGMISRTVPALRAGERPSIGELLRGTPYFRLIVLDLVLTAGAELGLALAVVPGLYVMVRWAVAPQVLELRHSPIADALKASFRLTRKNMLLVGALLLCVLGLEEGIGALLEIAGRSITGAHFLGVPVESVVSLLVAAVLVKPIGALATISLALRLGA